MARTAHCEHIGRSKKSWQVAVPDDLEGAGLEYWLEKQIRAAGALASTGVDVALNDDRNFTVYAGFHTVGFGRIEPGAG